MAMNTHKQRGFALFIAVIFMSVMLTFGLELAALGYKQSILTASSVRSQYAFYAADAALECALYADQQQNLFAYPAVDPGGAPSMSCDGAAAISSTRSWTALKWVVSSRLSLDGGAHCADVMISKPNPSLGGTVYLYAQGYDAPCATVASPSGARFASRGLSAHYGI